jgi:thiosulfate/3-mercaptopyruvate sulfurtransferase
VEELYRGYVVDPALLKSDRHFQMGCRLCHQGNHQAFTKEEAHKGLVKRPTDNPTACALCHKPIADHFVKSLHYTTIGQRTGVMHRFSTEDLKAFDEKVFEKSCRSCHASCGDCHVKSPPVSGISTGLIQGHKFVRKNEGKTCASCHGGRVYPEFTGEYGGAPDVHYQKGMMCVDCHKQVEMHGDGMAYTSKHEVRDRPRCQSCHKNGKDQLAHQVHQDKVSCQGCHSGGQYRQCYSCHEGTGSRSKEGFILGLNPRDKKTLTTLRLVPTKKSTFRKAGIKMENYDALPNFWNSAVHNIRKQTPRTRSCDACHVAKEGFLNSEIVIKEGGSKANEGLIHDIKPIKK